MPDETITSWLARYAFAQGCAPLTLTGALWPTWRVWSVDADRGIPIDRRGELCRGAGVTAEAITAAALEPIGSRVAGQRPNGPGGVAVDRFAGQTRATDLGTAVLPGVSR